ncbi:hypothetical protein CC78DRAFT_567521 [Lojkania enalia]|uniref:Uncharacterized protein n=1 Tax=Lojkania enalia TaxID=147567 RepID=A0A9P4N6Z9_9PLEO|nr:hypothetical protein CC78DRAFT_567521 [Didymosphaeria enalia]
MKPYMGLFDSEANQAAIEKCLEEIRSLQRQRRLIYENHKAQLDLTFHKSSRVLKPPDLLDRVVPLITQIRIVATEYERFVCLDFSAKFHATLPREIRDMVYDGLDLFYHEVYIRDPKSVQYESRFDKWMTGCSFLGPPLARPARELSKGQIEGYRWRVEYLMEDVVREITERYYATTYFGFRHTDHHLISQFLLEDRWGVGLMPGKFVRYIQLCIDDDENMADTASKTKLIWRLEGLIGMSSKNAKLRIFVDLKNNSLGKMPDVLEVLAPTIYALKNEDRRRIRVALRYRGVIDDITASFNSSREQFRDSCMEMKAVSSLLLQHGRSATLTVDRDGRSRNFGSYDGNYIFVVV